jgi:ribosome-associated toxin RatA of RatAB toxin-antitoxin module
MSRDSKKVVLNDCDCEHLPFTASNIYKTLTTVPGYQEWWPKSMPLSVIKESPNIIGTQLAMGSWAGKLALQIDKCEQDSTFGLSFKEGSILGDLTWQIMPGESSNQSKLCYSADVKPNSPLARLMVPLFKDRFLKSVAKELTSALQKQLETQALGAQLNST